MTHQPPSVAKPFTWRHLIPILVFVAVLVAFFALGLERYLSIDALRQHRSVLRAWVETSGLLAALVIISATLGATILFSIAKTTLGDVLRAKASAWLPRLEAGFREHALSYLLVLRLVPIFPFFIINLVPAFLGVPLSTFILGTFLGIMPGTFVYATVGAGLGSVFDAGGTFSLRGVLTPQIVTALVGLAVLAMIPVVYKNLTAQRGATPGASEPHGP